MTGDDSLDLSRREFTQVGVTSIAALGAGGFQLQQENPDNPQEDTDFQGVGGSADVSGKISWEEYF